MTLSCQGTVYRTHYENGLPFSSVLATNLQDAVTRVESKKATLIIVSGGVGEGKTTLGVEIADYINKLNGLPEIEIETDKKGETGPQLAMGGVQFLKKMRICFEKKLPCIVYDEAGDFNKRGSLSNFNAMLNRTFETFRAFKCIVILCLPNFAVLDNQLFDSRVPRMLINCKDRTMNQGYLDGYDLPSMEWLKYQMSKLPIKAYAWGKVYPNFMGNFLNLTPERSLQLDRVSTSNKLGVLRKSEIKIEGLLNYGELATKLDRSVEWVRKAVKNLGIKHARQLDSVKYFSPDVYSHLAEHLEVVEKNDMRGKNRWKDHKSKEVIT